jgi:NAD(P)-dependent dehydrogenase (short-subunit alcohol dehydrogenase family)
VKHNFHGQRVLVTGGTRGIGRATVELFHSAGAVVAINGRTQDAVDDVISQLNGDRLIAAAGDLALPGIAARVTKRAAEAMGGLDILINNAGIFRQGKLESFDEDEWDRMLAVNLKAAFFAIQAAIPHLRKTYGAIVNVASESGLVGNYDSAVYCASKAGLINMTRALALELAPDVRVNCVCPGAVDTDMIADDAQRSGDSAAYLKGLKEYYPLRRMARPTEISEAIAYLASPAAAYVTGSALSIDGGSTAGH